MLHVMFTLTMLTVYFFCIRQTFKKTSISCKGTMNKLPWWLFGVQVTCIVFGLLFASPNIQCFISFPGLNRIQWWRCGVCSWCKFKVHRILFFKIECSGYSPSKIVSYTENICIFLLRPKLSKTPWVKAWVKA